MWRERVERVCADAFFSPPVREDALRDAEAALGVAPPPELCALLRESNGIADSYGHGILSAEQMIVQNREMRADSDKDDLYMPFDYLLFFAGSGSGDLFFFPVQGDGEIHRGDIFVWEHETDTRRWVAGRLEQFVEDWYSGELRV